MRKVSLAPAGLGNICSYDLGDDKIIVRLFGLFPVKTIRLATVQYLRLATRDEVSPAYYLLNWHRFLLQRRAMNPVYVLQTRTRTRILLKLGSGEHFRLRTAIGRSQEKPQRRPNV